MTDFQTFISEQTQRDKAISEANQHNKTVLLEALGTAGITSVDVTFDGTSDSGQIETVQAYAGNQPVDFPKTQVTFHYVGWSVADRGLTDLSLLEAIETLCYCFLEQEHDGWEIDEGAYGEFEFDVAERTITLEFNGRYTDINTSNHSF